MQMRCFSVIQAFRASKLRSEVEGKSHCCSRGGRFCFKTQNIPQKPELRRAAVTCQKEAPPPDGCPGDTGGSINLNITAKKIYDKKPAGDIPAF